MNALTGVDHSVRVGAGTSSRLRGVRWARSAARRSRQQSSTSTQHAPPGAARGEPPPSTEAEGPRVVHLAVSSALADYLSRVRMLGAVQATRGGLELNPTIAPVLLALHHVLAGGEVEVRITRGGQSALVRELQERAARTLEETQVLNDEGEPDFLGDVAV